MKHQAHTQSGITLIEILISVTIFTLVSIVITNSLYTMMSSRSQIEMAQEFNDELRLAIDAMEVEMTSATNFSTSDCADGVCKTVAFTVSTRPDIVPYRVFYSYDEANKTLTKTMQRNDGICNTLPLAAECTFPVNSDETEVTFVNFDIITSGTGFQRPVITIVLEGKRTLETDEDLELAYSTSFVPRIVQNVNNVEQDTDTTRPSVTFDHIVPSEIGCGVYSDEAKTTPYNNTLPWTADQQTLPDAYTDCEHVEIAYYGRDYGTGILGGRYDGYVYVDEGECYNQACSKYPRGTYSLPPGITSGLTEVYFEYENIPLRKGLGLDNISQPIYLRAKDMEGNINSPESHIDIYQISDKEPLTTDGMEGMARLVCDDDGEPEVMLMVAPSDNDNIDQRNIKVYRCTASDEFDACNPLAGDYLGDYYGKLKLVWNYGRLKYCENGGTDCYTSWYHYTFFNEMFDEIFIERDVLYTYGFIVYDPEDPSRETDIKLIEWDREFNARLDDNPETFSSTGLNDWDSRLEDGRAFPSTPYIGTVPADYCPAAGPEPEPEPEPETGDPDTASEPETYPEAPPEPESPTYTIDPEFLSAGWTVHVTLSEDGIANSDQGVPLRINGDALEVDVTVSSVSPEQSNVLLSPAGAQLTPETPERLFYLTVPNSMSYGVYDVELKFSGDNAEDEYLIVPLIVSPSSGGME